MALALLRPGWQEDYHKAPPIHPVVCLGRITQEERLPDGRYNLLLLGLARARVLEELPTPKLYRTARVELLPDVPVPDPHEEKELARRLAGRVLDFFANHPATRAQLRRLLESEAPLGMLCDVCGFALPLEVQAKQQLLAEPDVARRVRLLLEGLDGLGPAPGAAAAGHKFPPDFSAN
jgi:Lon protease-like protein